MVEGHPSPWKAHTKGCNPENFNHRTERMEDTKNGYFYLFFKVYFINCANSFPKFSLLPPSTLHPHTFQQSPRL